MKKSADLLQRFLHNPPRNLTSLAHPASFHPRPSQVSLHSTMSSDARDAGSRDVPGDGWAAGTGGIFPFPRSRGAQVSPRRRGRVRGGAVLAVLLSAGGANAVSVSVGYMHACAVLNDGKLMCWGSNADGQLGIGVQGGSSVSPAGVNLGSGRTAKAVACGTGGTTLAAGAHTCAILDDDTLKCWGLNTQGHLGYGDTTQRNDGGGKPRCRAHSEGSGVRVVSHVRDPRRQHPQVLGL